MHLDPNLHLALHRARTERSLADPRRHLPRRARPPGWLRSGVAHLLRRTADLLAAERPPEPRWAPSSRQA
jgi:hypothetical protein